MKSKKAERNFKIFLLSNSVTSLASGLFSPFYILFIQGFGKSISKFGLSIGLMALAGAITAYFAGKYSDKIGRKPFLIISGFILSLIIIGYTLINSMYQLYIFQILNGILGSIIITIGTTFLADLTRKSTRGVHIGRYNAITGIIAAFSVMISGLIAADLGYKIVFYIVAVLNIISTSILFFINEK